jgi:hypothetical protein
MLGDFLSVIVDFFSDTLEVIKTILEDLLDFVF